MAGSASTGMCGQARGRSKRKRRAEAVERERKEKQTKQRWYLFELLILHVLFLCG